MYVPQEGRTAIETGLTVTILNNVLIVLIFLTSILLTLTVLMNKAASPLRPVPPASPSVI